MGKSSAAEPTDPKDIAKGQTSTNIATAIANMWLSNPDIIDPSKKTTTTQVGEIAYTDPVTGVTTMIPRTQQRTELLGAEKQIFDANQGIRLGMANEGQRQLGLASADMGQAFTLGGSAPGSVEGRIIDIQRGRLDPLMKQQDDALAQQLADQGIRAGSAAYDTAMRNRYQGKNDAYNQMYLGARGVATSEKLAEEQARLNRIGFFTNGGQPANTNAAPPNRSQIPTTDVAGIMTNNDAMRAQQAQIRAQQQASMWGGIGSLLSGGLFALSDRRAKTDIKKVGKVAGHNTYTYHYKGEPKSAPKHVGFMAQEVEKKTPQAVKTFGGMRHVDYGAAIRLGV